MLAAGTQTQWARAWTSIPAACGLVILKSESATLTRDPFDFVNLCVDMIGLHKKAAGAGGHGAGISQRRTRTRAPQRCHANLPGPSSRTGTRHQDTFGPLD